MFGKTSSKRRDQDILDYGRSVFYIDADWDVFETEKWVQEVAKRSGQKVCWSYSQGRPNIYGLGDLDKIRNTIKEMLPELNKSINKYKRDKWGIISDETLFTEEHVDNWKDDAPRKILYRP